MLELNLGKLEGVFEIKPSIFKDSRGHFTETFNEVDFLRAYTYGQSRDELWSKFVQDNQSFSKKGVLRGLHLQKKPWQQGKLVRTITGKAFDVAVDLRPDSPTFKQYETFILDGTNQVYIPEGFAHGFYAMTDCIFFYKCTNYYNKESEMGLRWDDPEISIDWTSILLGDPIISVRDLSFPFLKDLAL